MNERIRELVAQATTEESDGFKYFDKEKFAQSIIRECLKIVEPDQTSGDEWCVTLDETAQSIRQHFGVSE